MLYVSTGGFSNETAFETASGFIDANILSCELSGGLFDKNIESSLAKLKSRCSLQIHNYFPPPKKPFVMNLASDDTDIINKTINHIKRGIDISSGLGINIYSFHAGYLLDPGINELGKKVKKKKLLDRTDGLNRFIDNVNSLGIYAKKMNTILLIENNVLSNNNYKHFRMNPFLMVEEKECAYVMQKTMDNVFLLVDLAHVKVSSASLGFDKIKFLESVDPWIRAYHLSDNDGLSDSNQPVRKDSWFWSYLKKDFDYCSLEVYGKSTLDLVEQLKLTKSKIKIISNN
jgi:sugar phosphate isomerase/epimerase